MHTVHSTECTLLRASPHTTPCYPLQSTVLVYEHLHSKHPPVLGRMCPFPKVTSSSGEEVLGSQTKTFKPPRYKNMCLWLAHPLNKKLCVPVAGMSPKRVTLFIKPPAPWATHISKCLFLAIFVRFS